MLRKTVLALNVSTSLQTPSAAETHLAEGTFLPEKQTPYKEKSLIYGAGN
jgi:hypothetical protein